MDEELAIGKLKNVAALLSYSQQLDPSGLIISLKYRVVVALVLSVSLIATKLSLQIQVEKGAAILNNLELYQASTTDLLRPVSRKGSKING